MRSFKTVLTVIGAITVLVLAGNTLASAATGGKFTLGKINKANKISVLKRTTAGPPLKLITKSSTNAPLTTNGQGKVANLNADKVDGLDSAALMGVRAKVYRYAFTASQTNHSQVLPTLAPGTYLATLNVVMGNASGTQAAPTGQYCQFHQSGSGVPTTQHGIVQTSSSHSWDPIVNAATVITTAQGNVLTLNCAATVPWVTSTDYPAEVTLTKLDGASIATTANSAGRVAPSAPSGAAAQ